MWVRAFDLELDWHTRQVAELLSNEIGSFMEFNEEENKGSKKFFV